MADRSRRGITSLIAGELGLEKFRSLLVDAMYWLLILLTSFVWQVRIFSQRFLNWRLVRGIGELKILTRVSYAMLIVVPILAGTWPAGLRCDQ